MVVAVTAAPSSEVVIRRAARIAERSQAELIAVHVHRDAAPAGTDPVLGRHMRLLDDLGAPFHDIHADDVVAGLVTFARRAGASQLVLGTTRRSRITELLHGSLLQDVLRAANDMDVHVIGQPDSTPVTARSGRSFPSRLGSLPRRRRQLGWLMATAGTAAATALLASSRTTLGEGAQFLVLQAVVLITAAIGGAAPALLAAVLAATSLNWYFLPPFHTWEIDNTENVLALAVFVAVGLLVGVLVTALAARTAAARRGQRQAEALARAAVGMAVAEDPLQELLDQLCDTLPLRGAALRVADDAAPVVVAGEWPAQGRVHRTPLPGGAALDLAGELGAGDEHVLDAFAAQLATLLERRRLREEAARADALAAADQLRTAILRAVSHDLRTPLASIKASVTSLRQHDVTWDDASQQEFLATIDEEADRLDTVIADLLDASRLEAGAIAPATQLVALDDIVPAAVSSISGLRTPVHIDVSATLPLVHADPGLLTRAIANIVANADHASPEDRAVEVSAARSDGVVELRIADHGSGVPPEDRERIFAPFQRSGDQRSGGVGLGLAVARGVVTAMGGEVRAEDTPGGGLTMVVSLPAGDEVRCT